MRTEHLACREVDKPLKRAQCCERRFERVVGANHVDAHRPHRAREHCVHPSDCGAVDDVCRSGSKLTERGGVEDVCLVEREVRM